MRVGGATLAIGRHDLAAGRLVHVTGPDRAGERCGDMFSPPTCRSPSLLASSAPRGSGDDPG